MSPWTIEKGSSVYRPLYPPEGGPVSGYSCCECKAVTRTYNGMIRHLGICHGVRLQRNIQFEPEAVHASN